MIDEPFTAGDTFFHTRDPRIKIMGAAGISLILALTSSFPGAGAGCLLTAVLLILSRPDPQLLGKRILAVNFFTFFLWLTLPLTYGGEYSFHFLSLQLSEDGIRKAALITMKTNGILFCFLALIATSPLASLGHALGQLGMPRKLTYLLLFSYRQLFIIHQEYERLQRAARLRGFMPANSLHTYRTYGYLFAMTLVRSWNRGERIHQAMLLRGFHGTLIPLTQPQPDRKDLLFLFIMILLCLVLTVFSFSLYPYTS